MKKKELIIITCKDKLPSNIMDGIGKKLKEVGKYHDLEFLLLGNGMKVEPRPEISLRDYFAGQFLAGAVSNKTEWGREHLARRAYCVAEAMLEERDIP